MAMLQFLRGLREGRTVDGFRSTFRDWTSERTNFPNQVAEKALAHVVSNKAEAAYRRGDLVEKRICLMRGRSRYCQSMPSAGVTVQLRETAAG